VCQKSIKNSQPFVKKFITSGGGIFTHTVHWMLSGAAVATTSQRRAWCILYENSKLCCVCWTFHISDRHYAIYGPLLWYIGPAARNISGLTQVVRMILYPRKPS